MIPVEEARDRLIAMAPPSRTEAVSLAEALGRVPTRRSVIAEHDVPPFANSALTSAIARGVWKNFSRIRASMYALGPPLPLRAGATGGLLVVLAERWLGVGPGGFGALLGAIGVGVLTVSSLMGPEKKVPIAADPSGAPKMAVAHRSPACEADSQAT